MNHLTEIHLPTDGWSSHADRQRLLWALPRRVTVQWSKSRELRSPKVQSKFQSKLNQNEKNENNEQTVAVVLPVQPDDSNDPGHAQVLIDCGMATHPTQEEETAVWPLGKRLRHLSIVESGGSSGSGE